MNDVNKLDLLTLLVGLSVYVASIRLVVIGRLIGEETLADEKKASYKRLLKWLIPVDAALGISAIFLFLHIFSPDLFGSTAPDWFLWVVVWTFFFAMVYLAVLHIGSWVRSLRA